MTVNTITNLPTVATDAVMAPNDHTSYVKLCEDSAFSPLGTGAALVEATTEYYTPRLVDPGDHTNSLLMEGLPHSKRAFPQHAGSLLLALAKASSRPPWHRMALARLC